MEALGGQSISRASMGGGHAFRLPKTSVCRWQVRRHYRSLLKSILLLQDFPKDFWPFVRFLSLFLFDLVLSESAHYEKQKQKKKKKKKKNMKITTIYKPFEQAHYCVELF